MLWGKEKKCKADDIVTCTTCRHLIRKEDAQKVDDAKYVGGEAYYCPKDKLPYDIVLYPIDDHDWMSIRNFDRPIYCKRTNLIEVNKNGKPIKKK